METRGHFWRNDVNQWTARRGGAIVFVNFVSKRISQSALREAFELYGRVTDVYIAYKNPTRVKMRSTFVFVRFSNMGEATKAVEFGNNRRMDGFTIKVFLKNKYTEKMKDDRKRRQMPWAVSRRRRISRKFWMGRRTKKRC
ncbi:hypothetical protein V6N13_037345 [Hibiscus sabdariffa]